MVSRASEQAYQNNGVNSRGHQEFAEILDNISNENNTSLTVVPDHCQPCMSGKLSIDHETKYFYSDTFVQPLIMEKKLN